MDYEITQQEVDRLILVRLVSGSCLRASILVLRLRPDLVLPAMKKLFTRLRDRRPKGPSPSADARHPVLAVPARAITPNSASDSNVVPSEDASAIAHIPSPEPAPTYPAGTVAPTMTNDSGPTAPEGVNDLVVIPTALERADPAPAESANADTELSNSANDSKTTSTLSSRAVAKSSVPTQTQKTSSAMLQNVKRIFQLAEAGLAGIGIPGVEAIAKVPLWIIGCYEVCTSSFRRRTQC